MPGAGPAQMRCDPGGGPENEPAAFMGTEDEGTAYSAASAAGMTEMKVRPPCPVRKATRPSATAKIV